MLSARLVQVIEDHAEELTHGLLKTLRTNPRTPDYHRLSLTEIYERIYNVYSNLGQWLWHESDELIAVSYNQLGKVRCAEGMPLSEVVYALMLTKYHLLDYIRTCGLADSAVQIYQQQELDRLVSQFFDKTFYYTAKGYERETSPERTSAELAGKV